MWGTHKRSVWVLCCVYLVWLGVAVGVVFWIYGDKPLLRKYCLVF